MGISLARKLGIKPIDAGEIMGVIVFFSAGNMMAMYYGDIAQNGM